MNTKKAKNMPPPPDNVVPLDIDAIPDLYPLKTTEPPTTPKLFGFKNVDSYFQFQVEQKSQVFQQICSFDDLE